MNEPKKNIIYKIKEKIDYSNNKSYNIQTLIIVFFLTAFIGWIYEILLEFITNGRLVNKGTLIGPYLPIYGYGCLFILLIFTKTKLKKTCNNIPSTFLLITIICTTLEYCTSLYLEKVYCMRWWDYSNLFLNLHGRISFLTSLIFGTAGCFGLYFYAPFVRDKISNISKIILNIICIFLIIVFMIDNIYCFKHPNSGEGITTIVIKQVINLEARYREILDNK